MSNLSGKELMKNINDIIDNCNCWLEDEEADEETIKWFKMEKETIITLLNLYNEEEENNNFLLLKMIINKEYQIIRLLIQDLQIEGYFDEWTEEDILKYYERRVRKENE